MQLHSRETLLFSTFLVSMSLLVSVSMAALAEVSLQPVQTLPDQSVEFSLSVKNLGGGNINQVELVLPQNNNLPVYIVSEIGNQVGWTYEARYTLNAPSPFRIIWSTAGSGISSPNSLDFNFVAKAPVVGGEYDFDWTITELNGQEDFGTVEVTNFNPTLSSLGVKSAGLVNAGKEFELTVTALDQNGNRKTDYTGTVTFSSSDPLAILPGSYTFGPSDNSMKTFKLRLKTAGEQEIRVSDGTLQNSVKVNVQQGDPASIELALSSSDIGQNADVTFSVESFDVYGNGKDVTKDSTFEIDREARGKITKNVYTTEVLGKWTVTATYTTSGRRLMDGSLLTVTAAPTPAPTPTPEPTPTPPAEPVNVSMEIVSDNLVEVSSNSTKIFSITVRNTGEGNISNVSLRFSGFPETSLSISPSIAGIEVGESQRFTVTITAPDTAEASNVEFVALSSEYSSNELSASKTITINVTRPVPITEIPATGGFVLSKNLTYLGIAIVVAVVLIILFWALFLREEPKKKKAE